MEKIKVGILGSGNVAMALAAGFINHGHPVMLGTRDESKLSGWAEKSGGMGHTGSVHETAGFGELIILAVKGTAAMKVLESAGKENLKGKIIIDTTNPIADKPPTNGVLSFFTDLGRSLMEDLQQAFPAADFVKAFNSVGYAQMVNPSFESRPTMFICGNSQDAKRSVTTILELFNWDTEDLGSAEAARAIEPLCILWCIPGFLRNEWNHAFKLLK